MQVGVAQFQYLYCLQLVSQLYQNYDLKVILMFYELFCHFLALLRFLEIINFDIRVIYLLNLIISTHSPHIFQLLKDLQGLLMLTFQLRAVQTIKKRQLIKDQQLGFEFLQQFYMLRTGEPLKFKLQLIVVEFEINFQLSLLKQAIYYQRGFIFQTFNLVAAAFCFQPLHLSIFKVAIPKFKVIKVANEQ